MLTWHGGATWLDYLLTGWLALFSDMGYYGRPEFSRIKESEMSEKPSDNEVAKLIGITENEVGTYRVNSDLRPDGRWLIYFGYQMPVALRKGLTGSFTFLMPEMG